MHRTPKWARHASPLPCNLLCFLWRFCVFCGFPAAVETAPTACEVALRRLAVAFRSNAGMSLRGGAAAEAVSCSPKRGLLRPYGARNDTQWTSLCQRRFGVRRRVAAFQSGKMLPHSKGGRGTPRPYLKPFCGFSRSIFKTGVFCRGALQNGRGTPRPYPATFCVFCAFSVSSVFSSLYFQTARVGVRRRCAPTLSHSSQRGQQALAGSVVRLGVGVHLNEVRLAAADGRL